MSCTQTNGGTQYTCTKTNGGMYNLANGGTHYIHTTSIVIKGFTVSIKDIIILAALPLFYYSFLLGLWLVIVFPGQDSLPPFVPGK